MALDMTSFDAALKDYYKGVKVQNLAAQKNPALAMIKKNTGSTGRRVAQPIQRKNPRGASADFATAKTNATVGGYDDLYLTRSKLYQFVNIDNETILASDDKNGAFLRAVTEIDAGIANLSNRLSTMLFRSGAVGQISSDTTIGSTTLKLADPGTVFDFQDGDILKLSATKSGGSVRTGSVTVAARDLDAGTITLSAAITTGVAAAAVGDYVFFEGDYGNALSGFDSWIPDDAPGGGDSFFGLDRSGDTMLHGLRLDASGMSVEEALQRMSVNLVRAGGQPDIVYANPSKVADLAISLGSKRNYVDVKGSNTSIGFQGFQVECPGGSPVKVIADRSCPEERAYMLTSNTWMLHSLGSMPRVLDKDGQWLRSSDADAYEVRLGSYGQLGCNAPGWNGVIKFS